MAETPEPQVKGVGNIPFIFYDVIGRMIPGAFLIVGMVLNFNHRVPWPLIASFLDNHKPTEGAWAFATLIAGTAILVFAIGSSFLGFAIGGITYLAVEELGSLAYGSLGANWFGLSPLDWEGLGKFYGIETDSVKSKFRTSFGFEPQVFGNATFLCTYYIWKMDPNLGTMEGRFDSDCLAARNSVFVSLVLLLIGFPVACHVGFSWFRFVWLLVVSAVFFGSWLEYRYQRQKRVYGRIGMFLALANTGDQQANVVPAQVE